MTTTSRSSSTVCSELLAFDKVMGFLSSWTGGRGELRNARNAFDADGTEIRSMFVCLAETR